MTATTGAAYGKVILLGEHAVVYGAPALAVGIERGARARAETRSSRASGESALHLAGREHAVLHGAAATQDDRAVSGAAAGEPRPSSEDLSRAFAALLAALPSAPPVRVEAECDLPPGGGLGSSAALGVAIARAVAALERGVAPEGAGERAPAPVPADDRALAAAGAWERVFHGNPSGIDTAAAALGGCFRFTRADGARPIAPRKDLWLCVGSTGAGASTREMVAGVARLFERKPELGERSIAGITALVENAALAIEAGDLVGLGRLMDLNQMILAGMFVSTEPIEAMCALAREAGALGAKLTGAGGGGSVVALVGAEPASAGAEPPSAHRVLSAWRSAGYDGFVTRVPRGATAGGVP